MEHEPDGAHETAVEEEDLRGWTEDLKRFVTGIQDAALGQGERIDPGQLLADFREAHGRWRPRLLAARGQPSPDTAGEQEAYETPVFILPNWFLDRLLGAWGLIEIIDNAAAREGQGAQSDPDQLLTELTAELFKDEEEVPAPASHAAASPAMHTSMIAGAAHTTPYRCKLVRRGRRKEFCCETIQARNLSDADLQMTDLLLSLPRGFNPTKDSPKKNKKCKPTKPKEKPCRNA